MTNERTINTSTFSVLFSSLLIIACIDTIRIYQECEGGIENSVPRVTDRHQEAVQVNTNGNPEGQMLLFHPHTIELMDSFSCSSFNTAFFIFKKRYPEAPE